MPITTISCQEETLIPSFPAESGEDQDREHDQRDREDGVEEPADDVVDPAAEVAHHEPEHRAEPDAEQRRGRRDLDHAASTDDDPGEDVTPVAVEPQRVIPGRRLVAERAERLVDRVVRDDLLPDERAHDPEEGDDRPENERLRPEDLPQGLLSHAGRAVEMRHQRALRGGWAVDEHGHRGDVVAHRSPLSRMRGLRAAVSRSPSSVAAK